MCLWTTLFVESWKRRNAHLAMLWGMHGFEKVQQE
jgi:hypothetical protein